MYTVNIVNLKKCCNNKIIFLNYRIKEINRYYVFNHQVKFTDHVFINLYNQECSCDCTAITTISPSQISH